MIINKQYDKIITFSIIDIILNDSMKDLNLLP